MGNEPLRPPLAETLKRKNLAIKLHIRHVAVNLTYLIYTATVHILVGIVHEQIAHGLYREFLLQSGSPIGPYPLQILYVLT